MSLLHLSFAFNLWPSITQFFHLLQVFVQVAWPLCLTCLCNCYGHFWSFHPCWRWWLSSAYRGASVSCSQFVSCQGNSFFPNTWKRPFNRFINQLWFPPPSANDVFSDAIMTTAVCLCVETVLARFPPATCDSSTQMTSQVVQFVQVRVSWCLVRTDVS